MPRFERIIRETDWAIGHVAADWCLEDMGEINSEMIRNIFDKSGSNRCIIVDKNLELEKIIKQEGYEIVSEKWVRETTGVGLEVVSRMEMSISTIEEGLRFGRVRSDRMEIRELDQSLLKDVQVINSKKVREVILENVIAFETVENGSLVKGRIAVQARQAYEDIIEEFCHILEQKYDNVSRKGSEIFVEELVFSPEKARILGVEEGPKFGELASGESVEVKGKMLNPKEVQEVKNKRYNLS